MRYMIWIFWPSFVVSGIAEGVFFTLFDPADLHFFGQPVHIGRTAVYTLGFFMFWALAAASSALTCFLQRSAEDINRLCPFEPSQRPSCCPKTGATDSVS